MLKQLDNSDLNQILKTCPMGVALSDEKQNITWVNDSFQALLGISADEINGLNINELPEILKPLFTSDTTVHVPANSAHDDQYFMCNQSQFDKKNLTIHYITDVGSVYSLMQERDELKDKLQDALAIDKITGMPNKDALYHSLEAQVSRSRRYNNLLSIVIMRVNHLADLNEDQSHDLLLSVSQMLNDQVRWADIVGKLNGSDFLLVLPESGNDACINLSSNLTKRLSEMTKPDSLAATFKVRASFGYAQWDKGEDLGLLMQKAQTMLDNQ